MARIEVGGLQLDYELIGDEGAPPLMLTPGGRYPRQSAGVPELGRIFADNGYRVLLWDRPGCGASDIAFTAPTESQMNADAAVGLIEALGLKNITLVGGSAGSRISLMAGIRMPHNVSKIAVWWFSGGPIGLAGLAYIYCSDQVTAAAKGGMEAVAQLPSWADQISRNPGFRDILLRQDPEEFIAVMQKWAAAFLYRDDTPMPGIGPEEFAKLTMPVLAFRSGKSDMAHPARRRNGSPACCPTARSRTRLGAMANGTTFRPSPTTSMPAAAGSSAGRSSRLWCSISSKARLPSNRPRETDIGHR